MIRIIPILLMLSLFIFSCNGQKKDTPKNVAPKESSLESLNAKIEQNPKDAGLLVQRAAFYEKKMQTNKAIADMQAALNLEPENTDYYLTLADYFMQAGQLKNTIGVLKKILSIDPKNSGALLKMAEINLILKKYNDVFVYANTILENDPYNSKAFFIRAYTYKELGDTAKAVENFRETVKYDPKNYNALNELGLIFSAKKDIIAIDYFKNAIAVDSTKEDAYYYIGMFYQNNDYLNEALDVYRDLIKRSPKFPYSYYNTGYIYLELLKVPDEAIPYFTQAIQVSPNYFEAYFNRGLCFEILGDVYKAQSDYQMALKLHPGYQKAIDGLNRVKEIMSR